MTDKELEAGTPTPDAVSEAAAEAAQVALNDLVLIGLFTGPKGAKALLRMPGGRFEEVKIGDKVAGAKVAAIDSDNLILSKGGATSRLRVAQSAATTGGSTRSR